MLASQPHYVEGALVEIKRAVPREEMAKPERGGRGGGGKSTSTKGRLFVGRLNYDTNDTVLQAYFER